MVSNNLSLVENTNSILLLSKIASEYRIRIIAPHLNDLITLMTIKELIEAKLREALNVEHIEVINESHLHAGHAHGGIDTHFRLVLVSQDFEGKRPVARQQMVYKILNELINNPVHALAMQTLTSAEWQ